LTRFQIKKIGVDQNQKKKKNPPKFQNFRANIDCHTSSERCIYAGRYVYIISNYRSTPLVDLLTIIDYHDHIFIIIELSFIVP
jgi:hypothetical protein